MMRLPVAHRQLCGGGHRRDLLLRDLEVNDVLGIARDQWALLAAGALRRLVRERKADERRLQVAEVQVGGACETNQTMRPGGKADMTRSPGSAGVELGVGAAPDAAELA